MLDIEKLKELQFKVMKDVAAAAVVPCRARTQWQRHAGRLPVPPQKAHSAGGTHTRHRPGRRSPVSARRKQLDGPPAPLRFLRRQRGNFLRAWSAPTLDQRRWRRRRDSSPVESKDWVGTAPARVDCVVPHPRLLAG